MTRKKINKLLIGVMILIYGSIVFKYFGFNTHREKRNPSPIVFKSEPRGSISLKDTFQLQVDARDPFLDQLTQTPIRSNRVPIKTFSPTKQKRSLLPWPTIEYYGFLKAGENKKARAVVEIDSKRYNLRVGEKINGLKIKNVFMDSLEVEFTGTTRIITKE